MDQSDNYTQSSPITKTIPEKRKESGSEIEFITVTRRKPKRFLRNNSNNSNHVDNKKRRVEIQNNEDQYNKVCLTYKEPLPKLMA